MTAPASDTEATVLCQHLASWRLHDFATRPAHAIREERNHGTAGGGWITTSTTKGIGYEYCPGHGWPVTLAGVVPWTRVTELVRAAATPQLVAALGRALDVDQQFGQLGVEEMWARQDGDRSPVRNRRGFDRKRVELTRRIYDLGEQIRDRIRNPHPLGQLDLFDLIGAAS